LCGSQGCLIAPDGRKTSHCAVKECLAFLSWEGNVSKMYDCIHVRLVELESSQQQKILLQAGKKHKLLCL